MANAFYQAGMFYRSTGELEKSEEMFKIAADYGMVDAEYEIFKTQLKNEETEEIVQELKKFADRRFAEAMVQYGKFMSRICPALALEYFHKAEWLGDSNAYFELGNYYSNVKDEAQPDYQRAFEYYQKAADGGCIEAHAMIADMYIFGNGIRKDDYAAYGHLLYASEHGDANAMCRLAFILKDGLGCVQNEELANQYFTKAIEAGNPEAMLYVSVQLGVSEDPWTNTESYWDAYWSVKAGLKTVIESSGLNLPLPQRVITVVNAPEAK